MNKRLMTHEECYQQFRTRDMEVAISAMKDRDRNHIVQLSKSTQGTICEINLEQPTREEVK